MSINFDDHELTRLGVDLGRIGAESTREMIGVFKTGGERLVTRWADNARATSGAHGKHYPDSIDSEMKLSANIVIEVGPNPAKPQGGMSFEDGSVNQPPHPDGARAADVEIPALERDIVSTVDRMFRS